MARKGAPRLEPENGWNDRTSKTRLKARGPAKQISLVAADRPGACLRVRCCPRWSSWQVAAAARRVAAPRAALSSFFPVREPSTPIARGAMPPTRQAGWRSNLRRHSSGGAPNVNWTVSGGDASAGPGTINSNGQYTPPSYLTANSVFGNGYRGPDLQPLDNGKRNADRDPGIPAAADSGECRSGRKRNHYDHGLYRGSRRHNRHQLRCSELIYRL